MRSGFGVRIPFADRYVGCAFADPGRAPTPEQAVFLQAIFGTATLLIRGELLEADAKQ